MIKFENHNETDSSSEEETERAGVDYYKRRHNRQTPRFVKNDIDQIDTDEIVINLSRTQYPVVEEVAKSLGWKVQRSRKSEKWDVLWVDSHIQAHELFKLHEHQKISHYPSIEVLTRKNFLSRSLIKLNKLYPQHYSFFPLTWNIPSELNELQRYDAKLKQSHKFNFYIYKPEAQAQGRGIRIVDSFESLDKTGVVQTYINNPYLIEGLKFDLRIYVLIMGCDPLRIFVYNEGLARFATNKYQPASAGNLRDLKMHLTNYAINKNSKKFIFNKSVKEMDIGHKRSISAIYRYLSNHGVDIEKLKTKIDEIIVKTLLVGQPMIAHTYSLAQSETELNDLCFQILGFDILLSSNLQPMLLEVNHTPSLKTDTPLDKVIKRNMIKDALRLQNITVSSKKDKMERLRSMMQRRAQGKNIKLTEEQRQLLKEKTLKARQEFEASNLGNYRKVYPNAHRQQYSQIIESANSLFTEQHGIRKHSQGKINSSFASTKLIPSDQSKLQSRSQLEKSLLSGKQQTDQEIKKMKSQVIYREVAKLTPCARKQPRAYSYSVHNLNRQVQHQQLPRKQEGPHQLSTKQRVGRSTQNVSHCTKLSFADRDYFTKGSYVTQKMMGMSHTNHAQKKFDSKVRDTSFCTKILCKFSGKKEIGKIYDSSLLQNRVMIVPGRSSHYHEILSNLFKGEIASAQLKYRRFRHSSYKK